MITAKDTQQFCGRAFTREELSLIQEVVETCAGISRTELSHTVCELLEWRRANGGLKPASAWTCWNGWKARGF